MNGNIVEYFNHDDDQEEGAHRRDLGRFWAMDLVANDEVYLSNLSGDSIYTDENDRMYFMGHLAN